jgi:undecaprenyl-phosphate 4-deoxy-4-formamido-L-arabinose transferase
MSQPINLSVVIPVYNGEKTIGALVDELVGVIRNTYRPEIVLVNDCSKDGSEKACEAIFQKYPGVVRFYSLAKNVGEHNAVMCGLAHTTGDYAVIMDDDFQNPPAEAIRLVEEAVRHNHDVVFAAYDHKKHPVARNFGSWVNDKAANLLLGKPRDLYLCSFKVLNRFLIDEVKKNTSPFPYLDGIILQLTSNIGRLHVSHSARAQGRSGYTLSKLLSLWLSMSTGFSVTPLRFATFSGLAIAFFALCYIVITIIDKLMHPDLPMGYPALVVLLSLFSGAQLFMLGIMGEYIGRNYIYSNRKPQYTIRKTYEPDERH